MPPNLGRLTVEKAAINAVHTESPSARDTDWSTIVALYGRLAQVDPSPIVRLNRAVAVAELDGLKRALGRSTRSALTALLPFSRNDYWELGELKQRLGR